MTQDDARQFAELLQRLDQESFELARATMNRLKHDHDGSFTLQLQELYARGFSSQAERRRAIWKLIVDGS